MAENDKVKEPEDDVLDGENTDKTKVTDPNEEVTADTDPVEAAIEAALAAKIEAIRETVKDETRREFEERRQQDARDAEEAERNRELLNSFGATVREVRDNLKSVKFLDQDGNEKSLSDDEIENHVVKSFQRYNQNAARANTVSVYSSLLEAAKKALPESARESFLQRASGKQLDEWLSEFAESKAEQTNWAKRSKAEQEAAVKVAEAKGFKKGQVTPPNPPGSANDTSKVTNQNVDRSTLQGAAKALANGLISEDDYREIFAKLRG